METFRADPFMTAAGGRRALRSFSLAECDRRYARVRELMAAEGIEAILAPGAVREGLCLRTSARLVRRGAPQAFRPSPRPPSWPGRG